MFSISKIKDAAGASTYFRDRDDYYTSDHSPNEWWGTGAHEMGLAGEVNSDAFRDVLTGKIAGRQEYPEGYRTSAGKSGKGHRAPAHMPGWDATFSAPKSLSVAALVHGDARLIAAHDAAVREAMASLEHDIAITRQRDGRGEYKYRNGAGIAAAMFRHASSRDLDPQLHTHVVIANALRDPTTGKWVSIDSREGLYKAFHEAESLYMNGLAARVRESGYGVEWSVGKGGFPSFELTEIPQAERDLYSTRKAAIDAKLAAEGATREQASRAERQAATLDTRSPKQAVPAAELRRQWLDRLAGVGDQARQFVQPEPWLREAPVAAADAALASAVASITERSSRFVLRDMLTDARIYSQGRATEAELQAAVQRATDRGELIATDTLARVPGGELAQVPGFTTKGGQATEQAMLAIAAQMRASGAAIMPGPAACDAVEAADAASGGRLTDEHKVAARGILSSDSRIEYMQGFAGSAKTSGVLVTVTQQARAAGWKVEALAPTASAAETLGKAIDAKPRTVAAAVSSETKRADHTLWIVDEAGQVGAGDMAMLLAKADQAGAKVVLVGDVKQIGSVTAGRAFDQLQQADPQHVFKLTRIFRQRNEALLRAVEAAARGDVKATFAGVTVAEHRPVGADENARIHARVEAIADVAGRYMQNVGAGHSTLVVALSTADRDAINTAIQTARVKAGQVQDVQSTEVLRSKGWTEAEQADAARYMPGDVILARARVAHMESGDTAEVIAVHDGKVTVRHRGEFHETWSFDPKRWQSYSVFVRDQIAIGVGDQLVIRGKTHAFAPGKSMFAEGGRDFDNGARVTIVGREPGGQVFVEDGKGRQYMFDRWRGLQADLAYAQTADSAQGRTVDSVIGYVRSSQTNLATQQRLYVLASRAVYDATIVTDDAKALAERIQKRTGEKETALVDERGRDGAFRHPAGQTQAQESERRGLADRARDAGALAAGVARTAMAPSGQSERPTFGDVTQHQARELRNDIGAALHQRDPARLTDEQAVAAGRLAYQSRLENGSRVLPRDPPTWKDWKRMTDRHGVAVARDGTRYAMDDDGRIYSDRMMRADRREVARSQWIDHRNRRQAKVVGGRFSSHVIVSKDHGRTWHKAGLAGSIAARYNTWKRDRQQVRLETDRLRWQAKGGRETRDSEMLAREAFKSFQLREGAIFKGKLDWDELAARNGVDYDRDGRRYTVDGRGRVWSEALAKREWTVEHSRAGRDAAQDMQQHAHHAVRYRLARHRLENAIGDGRQRELNRLATMALDSGDKRWRDNGRHETGDSRAMACEALAAAGKGRFDWNQAALDRGVRYDRDGRRYATDDQGHARSEALEKSAFHFRNEVGAREARQRQDRGRGKGPLAWWAEQRTREAVWKGVENERGRLEKLAGQERARKSEHAPARAPGQTRGRTR